MNYFMMIGAICSPFLEHCIGFEYPKKFDDLRTCENEVVITKKRIETDFEINGLAAKVFIKCQEVNNGIGS
jgi:hypothetical protein